MLRKEILASILVMAAALSALPACAQDQKYDLVILNGRVMDPETNLDAVRNVGVKDGKITAVTTDTIAGAESIDARGHVVAPGFLDTHNHNVLTPFGQKLALRDGVTTPMELENGVLPVDMWYTSMEGNSQTNYGATVSVMGARETTFNPKFQSINGATINDLELPNQSHVDFNWSVKVASNEEIEKILSLLEAGLKQGALGVGYTPGYMVSGVTTRETVGTQKLAGKYGRFVGVHGRFSSQQPPTSGLLGTSEQVAAAAAHGGGVIVQHVTAQCLALSADCQKLIDDAYANGQQTIAEIYAYTYGGTIVAADYLHPENYQKNMGHDYGDIINLSNMQPLTKETYEELVKTAPNTNVTFENATKEDLFVALAHPTSIISSDSFPYVLKSDGSFVQDWDTPYDAVNGHPRGAGTHARILRLVREENLMPLMLAISKMSYMQAKFLEENGVPQMANKGRVKVGADADITIFDPDTVKDNSTPQMGGLPATGIPFVVVNGTIIVKDSIVLKDVFPGKPIRLPVQH